MSCSEIKNVNKFRMWNTYLLFKLTNTILKVNCSRKNFNKRKINYLLIIYLLDVVNIIKAMLFYVVVFTLTYQSVLAKVNNDFYFTLFCCRVSHRSYHTLKTQESA